MIRLNRTSNAFGMFGSDERKRFRIRISMALLGKLSSTL